MESKEVSLSVSFGGVVLPAVVVIAGIKGEVDVLLRIECVRLKRADEIASFLVTDFDMDDSNERCLSRFVDEFRSTGLASTRG